MKKILCIILALVMLTFAMTSCDNDDVPTFGGENNTNTNNGDNGSNNGNDNQSSEGTENGARVYRQYSNLVRIDQFKNGLATFLIYDSNSSYHWGSSGAWNGDYYYGFINEKGNVVIEPKYECSPHIELPSFEYNYIKVGDLDDHEYIIDKKGNVQFEVGKNNITAIGKVSEGYFWVETVEEDISGNMYTVRYYSADDLSIVATFNNIRAIPDNQTIGGTNSTLTDTGEGKLAYKLNQYSYYDDDLVIFNISEYDSSYAPKQDSWNIDLDQVENFSSASYYYYHVSSKNNNKGQLATVALKNSNGTWFYSIVDSNGNVLMQPQKNITFPLVDKTTEIDNYDFCKDLCPAKDADSGYWGYIDPNGNWKIQPQYSTATSFSADGYATVNDKIVINTEGKVILSPAGWANEVVTSLSGTYKYTGSSYNDWYLTFSEDGTLRITEHMGMAGSSWSTGKYQIKGSILVVSDTGYNIGCPTITKDGEYTFRKEGDTIIIGESEWKVSNVTLPEE